MLIANADKSGAVAICKTKNYISEVNWQLNVTSNYKTLTTDPIMTHNKLINDAIDRFKHERLIPKETVKTLKIRDLKNTKISYATKNT